MSEISDFIQLVEIMPSFPHLFFFILFPLISAHLRAINSFIFAHPSIFKEEIFVISKIRLTLYIILILVSYESESDAEIDTVSDEQ